MSDPEFKPVSTLAIGSITFSVIGCVAFLALPFLALAIVALALSMAAEFTMRKYLLSGRRMVAVSVWLSLAVLTLAPGWHLYLYRLESPLDYQRVDFSAPTLLKSKGLDQFENRTICLKGYALAPNRMTPLREFRFSPDGNRQAPENSIKIVLPFEWDYQFDAIAVSGTLKVNPFASSPGDRYIVTAVVIRKSNTGYGLAHPISHGC